MKERFFYEILVELFKNVGYETREQEMVGSDEIEKTAGMCDIIVEKDSQRYVIETMGYMEKTIYSYRIVEHSIFKLMSLVKDDMIPILATYNVIEKSLRTEIMNRYPSLIILDIKNLLAVIPGNTSLRSDLIASLPFTINDVKFEAPDNDLGLSSYCEHSDIIMSLMEELKLCAEGKKFARDYETICSELLKRIFDDQLSLWREQPNSNNNLFRFDMLCRIKNENRNIFWSIVENNLQSKYVVFEYKNYENMITQMQVFTTARYLYRKALRSFAVIIAANGYDDHAEWAVKGIYRESGKLILLLNKNDLLKMAQMKIDGNDPSELLLEKIDDLLMKLEV